MSGVARVWGLPLARDDPGRGRRGGDGADRGGAPVVLHHGERPLCDAHGRAARARPAQRPGGLHPGRRRPAGLGLEAWAGPGSRSGWPGRTWSTTSASAPPSSAGGSTSWAGGEGIAEEAGRKSPSTLYPGLKVVGTACPPPGSLDRRRGGVEGRSRRSARPGPTSCSWPSASPRGSSGSTSISRRWGSRFACRSGRRSTSSPAGSVGRRLVLPEDRAGVGVPDLHRPGPAPPPVRQERLVPGPQPAPRRRRRGQGRHAVGRGRPAAGAGGLMSGRGRRGARSSR